MTGGRYSWLPPVLRTIAEAAGLDAALTIAEQFGGRRVCMPRSAQGSNWLTRCVGREAARLILDRFGAGRLDIPLGPTGSYAHLRRQLARRYEELEGAGASAAEIAGALRMTERAVRMRRAKRKVRKPEDQASLL